MRPQPLTALALDAIQLAADLSATHVFPSATGEHITYRAELKRLHALCARLELPAYSFHQVRHWAGFVASTMGKNKKAVASFLGHADTHATEAYMHAIDAEKWEVARRLEEELKTEIMEPTTAVTKGAARKR